MIADDLVEKDQVIDPGAFPGTFLRLCRKVFFKDRNLRLYGAGLVLPDTEKSYRLKAGECPDIHFIASDLPFLDYYKSLGITFLNADFDHCFTPDFEIPAELANKFQAVTCMEVIEHLHTPYKLITTIDYLLKPGGICVLETNNVANICGVLKLMFANQSNLDFEIAECYERDGYSPKRPHLRFYSLKELGRLLKKTGLEIEHSSSFSWSIPSEICARFDWKESLRA